MNVLQLLLAFSGLCEVIPEAETQQVLILFRELAEQVCLFGQLSLCSAACADDCNGSSEAENQAAAAEQEVSSE